MRRLAIGMLLLLASCGAEGPPREGRCVAGYSTGFLGRTFVCTEWSTP